jgi:hypothetical protein
MLINIICYVYIILSSIIILLLGIFLSVDRIDQLVIRYLFLYFLCIALQPDTIIALQRACS